MSTFLNHYINFAAVNESPDLYHTWSGISLLSHLIGKRVWTDEGMWKIYPNLYISLVGAPGIAKSTAMDVAKSFIKANHRNIFVAPASITKESIIQTMAREDGGCIISFTKEGKSAKFSQLSIFANEMVSLLNAGGNPIGMIDFLTDVWDQPEYRDKTKNKGDHTIHEPYVTILGCFTTDTARSLMHNKIITGGMSRRCIFVYADKNKKPVARITYRQDQLDSIASMKSMAEQIVRTSGEFKWTREADRYYREWYDENFYRGEKEQSDVIKHFLRSKAGICTKVSMLLGIAENPPTLWHTEENFRKAVELVTQVERGASMLFDSAGRNELSAIAVEVERFITQNGEVPLVTLHNRFWKEMKEGDLTELDKILDHLTKVGRIRLTYGKGGATYSAP